MDKYSKTGVFTLMRRTSFTPAVLLFPPLANEVFFFWFVFSLLCFSEDSHGEGNTIRLRPQ